MNDSDTTTGVESQTVDAGAMNRANLVVVIGFTVVCALLGAALWWPIGPIVAAVIGSVVAAWSVRRFMRSLSDRVLAMFEAEPVDEARHARVLNVLDGLCVVSGDHRPDVHVIDDHRPVALVTAEAGEAGHLLVSQGILDMMDRMETEAVVSHLLWRLRSGHAASATYAIAVAGLLARIGLGSLSRRIDGRFAATEVSIWADIAACQATRYPPAMISALHKCASFGDWGQFDPPVSRLMFVAPEAVTSDTTSGTKVPNLGTSLPTLDERIAVLKEI